MAEARRESFEKEKKLDGGKDTNASNRNALLRESSGHVRNLPVDCRSLTPLCLGNLNDSGSSSLCTSVTQYTHLIWPAAAVQDEPRKKYREYRVASPLLAI